MYAATLFFFILMRIAWGIWKEQSKANLGDEKGTFFSVPWIILESSFFFFLAFTFWG